MSAATLATWGGVSTLLAICFVLGAAPVFAVRLIGLLYPKGHERRAELIAEMHHARGIARVPEQWRWLGECLALGICEGIPLRVRHGLRRGRARRVTVSAPMPLIAIHAINEGVNEMDVRVEFDALLHGATSIQPICRIFRLQPSRTNLPVVLRMYGVLASDVRVTYGRSLPGGPVTAAPPPGVRVRVTSTYALAA